jgi:hypothetical protein
VSPGESLYFLVITNSEQQVKFMSIDLIIKIYFLLSEILTMLLHDPTAKLLLLYKLSVLRFTSG